MTFSEQIDTGNTTTPFEIQVRDVNNIPIATSVTWSDDVTKAFITFTDTLPTANYNSSPAYTSGSNGTKAIADIDFDLATMDGEVVYGLNPSNESIEIHTIEGLTPLSSNILQSHVSKAAIEEVEDAVDNFAKDGTVEVTFNHPLDTTLMKTYDLSTYIGLEEEESGINIPCTIGFTDNNLTITVTPDKELNSGKKYYLWLKNIPGAGISHAPAIDEHAGSFSGKGDNFRLIDEAFQVISPNIATKSITISDAENTADNVLDDRVGISAGFTYSYVLGTPNVSTASDFKFQLKEMAWNANHADSVEGYQVQVRRVDRGGTQSIWYDYPENVDGTNWVPGLAADSFITKASLAFNATSIFDLFEQDDADGNGSFYLNQSSLFNDSSQIDIRLRPYIGTGDPGRNEVGQWSNIITFVDNVAPCDSDFVSGSNCNQLTRGGVKVVESINFDNSGGSEPNESGYIDVTFPEDMDPNGAAPSVTFYYGTFGAATPPDAMDVLPQSGWQSARKYRFYISVPVYDYTDGDSGEGAFYSISVAGVKDMSGNAIQSYGTDGASAISDHTSGSRADMADADDDQVQGSVSVQQGFILCD